MITCTSTTNKRTKVCEIIRWNEERTWGRTDRKQGTTKTEIDSENSRDEGEQGEKERKREDDMDIDLILYEVPLLIICTTNTRKHEQENDCEQTKQKLKKIQKYEPCSQLGNQHEETITA